jgi:hypothetical protein
MYYSSKHQRVNYRIHTLPSGLSGGLSSKYIEGGQQNIPESIQLFDIFSEHIAEVVKVNKINSKNKFSMIQLNSVVRICHQKILLLSKVLYLVYH